MSRLSYSMKLCPGCGAAANQAMIRCRDCGRYFDLRSTGRTSGPTPMGPAPTRRQSRLPDDPFAEILAKADELFPAAGTIRRAGRNAVSFEDILNQAADLAGGHAGNVEIVARPRPRRQPEGVTAVRTAPGKSPAVKSAPVKSAAVQPASRRQGPVRVTKVKTVSSGPTVPAPPLISDRPLPQVVKVNMGFPAEPPLLPPQPSTRPVEQPPLSAAQQELIDALDEFEYGGDESTGG